MHVYQHRDRSCASAALRPAPETLLYVADTALIAQQAYATGDLLIRQDVTRTDDHFGSQFRNILKVFYYQYLAKDQPFWQAPESAFRCWRQEAATGCSARMGRHVSRYFVAREPGDIGPRFTIGRQWIDRIGKRITVAFTKSGPCRRDGGFEPRSATARPRDKRTELSFQDLKLAW